MWLDGVRWLHPLAEAGGVVGGTGEGGRSPEAKPEAGAAPAPMATGEGADDRMFTWEDVERIVQERLAGADTGGGTAPAAGPGEDGRTSEGAVESGAARAQGLPGDGADDGGQREAGVLRRLLVASEMRAQLLVAGVAPGRVERAVRLMDAEGCIDAEGLPSEAGIAKEIAALLGDFPELRTQAGTVEKSSGFCIGAGAGMAADSGEAGFAARISRAFGNMAG